MSATASCLKFQMERLLKLTPNRMAGYNIAKRIVRFIQFLLTVYLIRCYTQNFQKYSYFLKKLTFISDLT